MRIFFFEFIGGRHGWHSCSHFCLTAPGSRVQFPVWVCVESLSLWRLHILQLSAYLLIRSKDVLLTLIGDDKLSHSVKGISREYTWGDGYRAWVRMVSVRARLAKCPSSAL